MQQVNMIHKVYFERSGMLDKRLGPRFKFEGAKFGAEADTIKEAKEQVRGDWEDYINELKKEVEGSSKPEKPKTNEQKFEDDLKATDPDPGSPTYQDLKKAKEKKTKHI